MHVKYKVRGLEYLLTSSGTVCQQNNIILFVLFIIIHIIILLLIIQNRVNLYLHTQKPSISASLNTG